ncbi:SCP-like extracellular protein [Colletotrichum incanum]|nr:SCP-like extracellular protein [Colletotrichum incanum]
MFVKVIITAAATGLTVMGVNAAPLTTDQAQALQIINKARVVAGVPALDYQALCSPGPRRRPLKATSPSSALGLAHSNGNPLCGRQVLIRGPKGDATVTITDKCMGCAIHDIDVSPAVFERIGGDKGLGRVGNVEWSLI